MKHRLFAFSAAVLMLSAPALAQQPGFTLPQLKAFAAPTPEDFRKPAEKGRIPGGETYQEFKRKTDVVRFAYPKQVAGMGLPSYTAVVWR